MEQTGFPVTLFSRRENLLCSTVYINLSIGNQDLCLGRIKGKGEMNPGWYVWCGALRIGVSVVVWLSARVLRTRGFLTGTGPRWPLRDVIVPDWTPQLSSCLIVQHVVFWSSDDVIHYCNIYRSFFFFFFLLYLLSCTSLESACNQAPQFAHDVPFFFKWLYSKNMWQEMCISVGF